MPQEGNTFKAQIKKLVTKCCSPGLNSEPAGRNPRCYLSIKTVIKGVCHQSFYYLKAESRPFICMSDTQRLITCFYMTCCCCTNSPDAGQTLILLTVLHQATSLTWLQRMNQHGPSGPLAQDCWLFQSTGQKLLGSF